MSRKINFFDGAESETTPVLGNLSASNLVNYADDAAFEAGESGAPVQGNIYFNTTDKIIRYYNGTAWGTIVDESTSQTLTSKTIDGNSNTISNVDGDNVIIDSNGTLPLGTAQSTAKDHQDALDAHDVTLTDHETRIGNNETNIGTNATNIGTNDTDIANLQSGKQDVSEKGVAGGYASLDGSGTVPAAQLPSYVDDVLEFADLASFPVTGETGKIYIALDTNFSYRWSGSVYVDITSKVDSVNSKTGAVVLNTDDVNEGTVNKYYSDTLTSANSDVVANTAKVSFPEAPIDGTPYSRQDGSWVAGGSGGGSGSTAKLIKGGNISWDATVGTVSFDADFFLEVAGLNYSANTIPVSESGFILNSDGQIAYVTPNDINPGGNLTVSVGTLSAAASTDIIIARRDGDELLIGDTTQILDGETRDLYDTTSGLFIEDPDAQSYNATLSNGTNVSQTTMTYKYISKNVVMLHGKLDVTGAGGGGTFAVSLPSGITIDTTLSNATVEDSILGSAQWLESGVQRQILSVQYAGGNNIQFGRGPSGVINGSSFSSGDSLSYTAFVFVNETLQTNVLTNSKLHAQTASFSAYRSSSLVSSSSSEVDLVYDTIVSNNGDIDYSTSTGIATVNNEGLYFVNTQYGVDGFDQEVFALFVTDISDTRVGRDDKTAARNSQPVFPSVGKMLYFNQGDKFKIRRQSSTANARAILNTQESSFIDVHKIADFSMYGAAKNNEEIYASLASDTAEDFTNGTNNASGLTITLSPGEWELDYQAGIAARISGSSTNIANYTKVILRDITNNNYITDSFLIHTNHIQDSGRPHSDTVRSAKKARLTLTSATTFEIYWNKNEYAGGAATASKLAGQSTEFGATVDLTWIRARRVG